MILTANWIVRCLKRDLSTREQMIKYAQMVASCRGENAAEYAKASEILRKEGGRYDKA
jgi:hypothetical protein